MSRPALVLGPLEARDLGPLDRVLRATGAFDEAEVAVANELLALGTSPDPQGYEFIVAREGDLALGYVCFGDVPLTDAVHDLYWIAVAPEAQGRGVGRALMEAAEASLSARAARMLLIETASKPGYAATRAFYAARGYQVIARFPDFYRLGDDKLVFAKRFDGVPLLGVEPAGGPMR